MLILISNDDGVYSKGLRALSASLKKIKDSTVVVVAPDREQSASSHALTISRPLRVKKIASDLYSVDGTPTDTIMLAVHTILKKKPDLLVSGINRGANLGEDVHYSGTVAAAVEGAIMGIPAMAVSLAGSAPFEYGLAAEIGRKLAKKVLKDGLPSGIVLNVNVPTGSNKKSLVLGTGLGKRDYGEIIFEKTDPRGRPYYWIGGTPAEFENVPGSDCEAYLKNNISITPIRVDTTDYQFLDKIKTWKF